MHDEPVLHIEFEALYESDKYVQNCTHHMIMAERQKITEKSQGSFRTAAGGRSSLNF